jgi:hypothetical protein
MTLVSAPVPRTESGTSGLNEWIKDQYRYLAEWFLSSSALTIEIAEVSESPRLVAASTEVVQSPVPIQALPVTDWREPLIDPETGSPSYRWLPYVTSRLLEMSRRGPDPELPMVHPRAISQAIRVAAELIPPRAPAPSVVTSLDGGVEFIWHRGGWDVEIEIQPNARTMWARERASGRLLEGSLSEHSTWLLALLTGWASQNPY